MTDLQRAYAFLADFTRRQAERVLDLPGAFAALDDTFRHSHGNNLVLVTGTPSPDPAALPAFVDEAMSHLPFRVVSIPDATTAAVCAGPLLEAGYTRSTVVVMRHRGPVPAEGGAREVDLPALREPMAEIWRHFLPNASDEVIRNLVERRAARPRGADDVRFLASHDVFGQVASWADLYLDPASGVAQIEDLVTAVPYLKQGHAGVVLDTALRIAAAEGCPTVFLTALKDDWPIEWYARRGFESIGEIACFELLQTEAG
ncbi:GNAT family N-acetyltransferase [Streptomyces sp. NPDC048717]|uniref:GNAT family N-acetyltransferase n=1 Tax=Streptomyces sp. NPDC048717 TaxID=3154928 RepID=UPI0034137140